MDLFTKTPKTKTKPAMFFYYSFDANNFLDPAQIAAAQRNPLVKDKSGAVIVAVLVLGQAAIGLESIFEFPSSQAQGIQNPNLTQFQSPDPEDEDEGDLLSAPAEHISPTTIELPDPIIPRGLPSTIADTTPGVLPYTDLLKWIKIVDKVNKPQKKQ